MNEIELKFVIDEQTASRLWKRGRAARLISGRPRTRVLKSTYMDTPDHALWRAGIALRLRRDGQRWIQTVKAGGQLHGGLSQVRELEAPAPGGRLRLDAIDDAAVRQQILQLVNGAPLRPVCETRMKRTAGELCLADGTRAMLATDAGEICAGQRCVGFREAEIELIEGGLGSLFDMAHELFPDGGLAFSRLSKSARGYMLARDGCIDVPMAPRNAIAVVLDPAQTSEQAARDVLRECVEQIAVNVGVVGKLDDAEGPHQLRVGLRRLRSAFSVFAPVLDSPEMNRLNAEARWLGQEVGRLRDLDVATSDIVLKQADVHPDETGLAALGQALGLEAAQLRKELRDLLIDSRAQALLIDLVRFVETRGWLVASDFGQTKRLAAPVRELAREALSRRWKAVGKRTRKLARLTPAERHELRKKLKQLRYAAEFFAPLFPAKRTRNFLQHLKDLQEVFGDLNDVVMLKALFADRQGGLAGEPRLQRAIGWVIGASQARAEVNWSGAKALWRKLKKSRIFWL